MLDYIYEAKFNEVTEDNLVSLRVDLGFGVCVDQYFSLAGVHILGDTSTLAMDYTHNRLSDANALIIRSNRTSYDHYTADITFQIGSMWYNLSKSLVDNDLAMETEDASQ